MNSEKMFVEFQEKHIDDVKRTCSLEMPPKLCIQSYIIVTLHAVMHSTEAIAT